MAVFCYDGLPGMGKSYGMHVHAFKLVQEKKKEGIVTNQRIDLDELQKWAMKKKFLHLADIARRKRVKYETKLDKLLGYKNSVVIFDEAGIFANSHDWKELRKTNPNFVVDLCQQRKIGVDLIWSAQAHEMVDRQLRLLTNFYYACFCLSPVYWRYMFTPGGFETFKSTGKYRRQRLQKQSGFLDLDIFKIYNSYVRLENEANTGLSFDTVELADIAEQIKGVKYRDGIEEPKKYNVSTTGFYYQPRDNRPPVTRESDPELVVRLEQYRNQKALESSKVSSVLWLPEKTFERVTNGAH